jgi:hypothetical protein
MKDILTAADMLVRYSSLSNLPALSTSEISINKIDWERLENAELTKQESILIEVLRFILLEQTGLSVSSLLALNDLDLRAVLLALNTKYVEKAE